MKYLVTIYGSDETWTSMPAEEWPAAIAAQEAFNKKYFDTGELIGAYGSGTSAQVKVIRVRDGAAAVTDGPYLETKEFMGSFYILDVADEARAIEIAADVPWASKEAVELVPLPHESPAPQR
ncbi:hypothetical protein I6A84_35915 [Frankia sp. CNm7]|uniref:YCII-related domain-containing protein n=1 Tax=Frankia nepalensis TaxID=1836974 RepID=A0A937UR20_9ACTN|nr:YciI family protein [Frankia nepalensis]MBL7501939.1 hypothetical protein [Frankia nepalensis]MBL7515198.1 hypothetical protein [Frankia nepalensis]MBL7523328.1 hypothetical protein [Frankia nepalensis]MBL7628815.1 hypothetical protein [Frankia nepalensis]